jgi:hypothetical protein
MSHQVAEFAYDLHAGLAAMQVSEFDDLHVIGMAATLAIHIKGLGQIDYEVLRKVSDHYMSIPSIALEKVLRVLEQIDFVRLVERGPKIQQVIPNIPVFDDVYEQIGSYASSECVLNSHEQATLAILAELRDAPRNRDALYPLRLGLDVSSVCALRNRQGEIWQRLYAVGPVTNRCSGKFTRCRTSAANARRWPACSVRASHRSCPRMLNSARHPLRNEPKAPISPRPRPGETIARRK